MSGFNFGGTPSAGGGFSFGTPKTTANTATTGFSFASSGTGGGFNFGTPAQNPATSQPSSLFSMSTPAATAPAPGFSFGTPATPMTASTGGGFSLGTNTPKLNLGGTVASQPSTVLGGFGLSNNAASSTMQATQPAASTGFSFGTSAAAPQPATQPAATGGFSFSGGTMASVNPSGFGMTTTSATAQPAPTTGLSFGMANAASTGVSSTQPAATFSLGVQPTGFGMQPSAVAHAAAAPSGALPAYPSQAPGMTFGAKLSAMTPAATSAAASTAAPVTALSSFLATSTPSLFASIASSTAPATATVGPSIASTGLSLGATSTAAGTTGIGGLSFGLKPQGATATVTATVNTTSTSSIPSTGFSLGIKPLTSMGTSSTIGSLTTTTTVSNTVSTPPVMTYAQLESLINKWSLELEDQEKHFLHQATQVNAWDRTLIENGEKITTLHREVEKVKLDQNRLDQELDFILSQQKELEDLLNPLEESVKEQSGTIYLQHADEEREKTYKLAENIDAQLKRMAQDLKDIIEHLNTSGGPADTSDPLQQICKILNAHMLGNLVTMEWWNDLWLNEGFAMFMEYVSVNITHPELQVEDKFLSKCFNAMELDALNSSHPVSTPVENPSEIKEMFDDVSYDKGACILNMLRDYMSADRFQDGIVQYLHRYSYRNTKNEDLWNSMTDICPTDESPGRLQQSDGFCSTNKKKSHWSKGDILDVKAMMNTWTLQKGFPLITVRVKGKHVHLRQEHYMKGSDPSQPTGYLWHVPLTYITSKSDVVQRFLLQTNKDVIILPDEVEWIKFNVGMNGYYIVHYEADGWDALITLLTENHEVISSNDRASLINNAFQLVSIGRLPIDKALDLTLYLKRESQIMPVFQGMDELIPMYKLMEKREMEDVETRLKAYIVNLFSSLIDQQSWSDEGTVSERMLRSSLLLFACLRKYQPCVHKAEDYFNKWKESNGALRLPNDVKMAVYATGAQHLEGWEFLFEKYKTCSVTAERNDIQVALALTRNKEKLQWLLDQSLQDDLVKTQDLPYIVVLASKNPFGYSLAWQFFKKNWSTFVHKFELGSNTISYMVIGLTNQYSTKARLEEVIEFFDSLEENGSQLRCVQQAKETIVENIRWMDENLERVNKWLQNNSS